MRPTLFLASAAALVGLLALLLVEHPASGPAPVGSLAPLASSRPDPAPASSSAEVRPAVHGFITAYLAYESGDVDAAARVRASSAAALAHEVLTSRRRRTRRDSGPARITGLTVTRIPDRADLAIATGTLRRSSAPEPFGFLFARRVGRWLAVAPAE